MIESNFDGILYMKIVLIKNLKSLLEQHITKPMVGDDIMIDYKNFRKVGRLVGPKCK